MRSYLSILICFVAITHSFAASTIPLEPEPMIDAPRVILPGDLHYTTSLLDRYNAQVANANLIIPPLERLLQDAKNGLQGWLPCVPDFGAYPDYVRYPIYRHPKDDGVFVLILPPDQKTQIGVVIKEHLNRFVHYTCLADGFPVPRMGRVQAHDYQSERGSSLGALLAGILLGIAVVLFLRLMILIRR